MRGARIGADSLRSFRALPSWQRVARAACAALLACTALPLGCDGASPPGSPSTPACGTPVADSASPPGSPSTPACGTPDALWVASDYSSSAVGALALSGAVHSTAGRVDLGADPVLSVSRGRAFFLARDSDTVFELDPSCGAPVASYDVHLASHSGTSDPYDVAVASDGSLWVVLYEAAAILVLSPGGCVVRTIDLSSFDPDGNPDADAIAITMTPAGEKAFVALDRLNPYPSSVQPSWMLRVDVATGAVEAQVELAGRNPLGPMQAEDGILWLSEAGNFDDATESDAGVERFDTSTSTTSLVARESDLGGSVTQVSVSSGCGVAIVADPTPNVNATSLALFDPSTGQVLTPASASPLTTAGFDLEGLTWSGGALLVGDRRRSPSGYPVHVFDGACAPVERADGVFLPLPPIAVSVVE
jgi:streptogramin lyase